MKCGFFTHVGIVATSQKYKPHAPTKIAARKQRPKKKLPESVLPWATAPLSRIEQKLSRTEQKLSRTEQIHV